MNGVLTSRVVSTVSSPAVNYSAEYLATRSGTSIAFVLTVKGWLNSSASRLGTGAQLTVKARVNGGAWYSGIIKGSSAVWNDATKHTVEISIPFASTASSCTVEFYITRRGSSYGGTAGEKGSENNPLRYTALIPEYQPSPEPTPDPTPEPEPTSNKIQIRRGNQWRPAAAYVRRGNHWRPAAVYIRRGNQWR